MNAICTNTINHDFSFISILKRKARLAERLLIESCCTFQLLYANKYTPTHIYIQSRILLDTTEFNYSSESVQHCHLDAYEISILKFPSYTHARRKSCDNFFALFSFFFPSFLLPLFSLLIDKYTKVKKRRDVYYKQELTTAVCLSLSLLPLYLHLSSFPLFIFLFIP